MKSQTLSPNSPLYGWSTAQIRLKEIPFWYYKQLLPEKNEKQLIDLDILEREVPVTENNLQKSKKGLYKIKDNHIRFWFAFVYPNMSFIESVHAEIAAKKTRDGLISQQTSLVYKDICREKMWKLNISGVWPFRLSKVMVVLVGKYRN